MVMVSRVVQLAGAMDAPSGTRVSNRPVYAVDIGLGATMGGLEEDVELRDSEVPRLPPEKQIQQEEEVQTPPRRDLRRNEGHQPRGPRITTDESRL